MAFYTVPNTAQAEVKFTLHGKFLENVLNFRLPAGPITVSALEALGASLAAWYIGLYMEVFSEDLVLAGIYFKSLDFDDPYEFTQVIAQPGGDAAGAAPVNVACGTQFYTGMIGRSFKGKCYSSGMHESVVSGNAFEPTWVTLLQEVWNGLEDAIVESSWEHVIVSRQQDLVTINPAVATPVNTYQVVGLVRDMGRRLNNS